MLPPNPLWFLVLFVSGLSPRAALKKDGADVAGQMRPAGDSLKTPVILCCLEFLPESNLPIVYAVNLAKLGSHVIGKS